MDWPPFFILIISGNEGNTMNYKLISYRLAVIAFITALALVGMLFVDNALAEATDSTIYVDLEATGANNGTSWEDAFIDLQSAMDVAVEGDQVWVAAGTYLPTAEHCGAGDRYQSFQLKNGVGVYGGFDPSAGDIGWGDRDWEANAVILSGDIGLPGDNSDNSYHVFCHPYDLNLDSSAVLEGFIIQDGNANGNNFEAVGGGMLNENSPTFTDVIFTNNHADGPGGGIHNLSGSPELTRVTFHNNSASDGGGMKINGSPILMQVTFIGNSAAYDGGGILNTGFATLIDITFSNNTAGRNGGGLTNLQYNGLTIANGVFSANSTNGDGGGMFISAYSNLTLTNISFNNNTANGKGGGMSISNYSDLTLTNITFYNNLSNTGGAIFNYSSSSALMNCILWGNQPNQIDGELATASYSDIQGGYAGTGNIDADPLLGPLQDNGGFIWTHALGYSSPAIDAGNPDLVTCPATDARSAPRPIDGDGDGNAVCDMGSYEISTWISPTLITVIGPEVGLVGESQEFTALVVPISTTLPLTYVWEADGQEPITHTDGLTDIISFTWDLPGTQVITVTASNISGSVTDTHVITISPPTYNTYLPLIIKSNSGILTPTNPLAFLSGGAWIGLVIVGIVGWWKRKGSSY